MFLFLESKLICLSCHQMSNKNLSSRVVDKVKQGKAVRPDVQTDVEYPSGSALKWPDRSCLKTALKR